MINNNISLLLQVM